MKDCKLSNRFEIIYILYFVVFSICIYCKNLTSLWSFMDMPANFIAIRMHSYSQYVHVRTYKLVQMRIRARVNVHNTWYYCTSTTRRDCASVCLATTVNFVGILSIFERVYDVYRPTLNDWPIWEIKYWLYRGCWYIQSFSLPFSLSFILPFLSLSLSLSLYKSNL